MGARAFMFPVPAHGRMLVPQHSTGGSLKGPPVIKSDTVNTERNENRNNKPLGKQGFIRHTAHKKINNSGLTSRIWRQGEVR